MFDERIGSVIASIVTEEPASKDIVVDPIAFASTYF
jgi:hypothetical protein